MAKRQAAATTSVLVDIRSTVMTGGVAGEQPQRSVKQRGIRDWGLGIRDSATSRFLIPNHQSRIPFVLENTIVRAIKYRELKRMYDAQGPEKTVTPLAGSPASGRPQADGFQHPRTGRGDASARSGCGRWIRARAACACWRPATAWT